MAVEKNSHEETELSYMFHGFMKSVIKYSVLNALRRYLYLIKRTRKEREKVTYSIRRGERVFETSSHEQGKGK